MNEAISKVFCKFENLLITGEFNIDIKSSNSDKNKLEKFCDLFNLKTLVHPETCFINSSKSIIDLLLTNKLLHFQKPHFVEMRYCHKTISFFSKHVPQN